MMPQGKCGPQRCVIPAEAGIQGLGQFASFPYFHRIRRMEEKEAVAALAALAQPLRLRVFRALVGAGPVGMNPGELGEILGIASSTLSFHLKELVHAGMVTQERDGRNLIYRAALERMSSLMDYLAAHCCLGAGCEELTVPGCTSC